MNVENQVLKYSLNGQKRLGRVNKKQMDKFRWIGYWLFLYLSHGANLIKKKIKKMWCNILNAQNKNIYK